MAQPEWMAIYLAHRDTCAAFLTAADAEARASWCRWQGEYGNPMEARKAIDAAYTKTQGALNLLDVEGWGPLPEARALVDYIRALHDRATEPADFRRELASLREAFIDASRKHLGAH